MEKYLLEEFTKELYQIKEYIKHIEQVNSLAVIEISHEPSLQDFKNHIISFERDKKVFEYKAIIISLYGLLEKHIESWIQAYLIGLSSLVSYDKLSEVLRNKHFELSMTLIRIVMDGRQLKYRLLKKEEILKKLNSCIENPKFYKFNTEAFSIQTGNLTHNRIEELFKAVDISIGKELVKNKKFASFTSLNQPQILNTENGILFGKINELVERRNTIAHGSQIDDLLDLSALKPFIDFLENYCTAIFEVFVEKDIENQTIEKYREVACRGVFNKKTVIGVYLENYIINVGDWIIIKTSENGNEHFYKKTIKSLGKDNKNDFIELKIVEGAEIAVGIENQDSLPITKRCAFFLENR